MDYKLERNKIQPNAFKHEQLTDFRFVIADEQTLGNMLLKSQRAIDERLQDQKINQRLIFVLTRT